MATAESRPNIAIPKLNLTKIGIKANPRAGKAEFDPYTTSGEWGIHKQLEPTTKTQPRVVSLGKSCNLEQQINQRRTSDASGSRLQDSITTNDRTASKPKHPQKSPAWELESSDRTHVPAAMPARPNVHVNQSCLPDGNIIGTTTLNISPTSQSSTIITSNIKPERAKAKPDTMGEMFSESLGQVPEKRKPIKSVQEKMLAKQSFTKLKATTVIIGPPKPKSRHDVAQPRKRRARPPPKLATTGGASTGGIVIVRQEDPGAIKRRQAAWAKRIKNVRSTIDNRTPDAMTLNPIGRRRHGLEGQQSHRRKQTAHSQRVSQSEAAQVADRLADRFQLTTRLTFGDSDSDSVNGADEQGTSSPNEATQSLSGTMELPTRPTCDKDIAILTVTQRTPLAFQSSHAEHGEGQDDAERLLTESGINAGHPSAQDAHVVNRSGWRSAAAMVTAKQQAEQSGGVSMATISLLAQAKERQASSRQQRREHRERQDIELNKLAFSNDVTQDLAWQGAATNEAIKDVFDAHYARNKHNLAGEHRAAALNVLAAQLGVEWKAES